MDFSQLVEAVQNDERQRVNALIDQLTQVMVAYLRHNFNADLAQAQDTVQDTLIKVLEVIRDDQMDDPENIFSYILRSCVRNLIKTRKYEQRTQPYNYYQQAIEEPEQLDELVEEERLKLLYLCKDELKPEYQEYIEYWFERPGVDARSVAQYFNITVQNAWVRRHRIIKELRKCCKKKIQKNL